ncbi:hypothetical protein [Streptomyces iakyrus]|uniref:hypothetical protein n=1 Tax=Streptomyces iakyrus TaxID=68219 RepID=UPI000AF0B449
MSSLAPFALLTTLPRAFDFARPGGTPIGLPLGDVRTRHRDEPAALVEETAAISDACGGPADPAQALARYDAFPAATSCRTGPGARPGADTEPSPPAHPFA